MPAAETVEGSELAEDSSRSSQTPMHRGAPANPATRYIDCGRAAQTGKSQAVEENRWAADAGPPTGAVVYLRRASCWVPDPRTVRISARSTSALAPAPTAPSLSSLLR